MHAAARRSTGTPARVLIALALMAPTTLAGCGATGRSTSGPGPRPATASAPSASLQATTARTAPPVSRAAPRAGSVPPPLSRHDVYAADHHGHLSPSVVGDPARVYVPNTKSDTVDVIDQTTF